MMRMRIPNGVVNSALMRHYANSVEPYGPELGVIDITTRQNIQLRGVTLEDSPAIVDGLHALNQTSFHSALDTVRALCAAILRVFRDEGARGDRQKARLMWLFEEYGVDSWKARVLDDLATRGTDIDRAAL